MYEQYNYLCKFNILPLGELWKQEFLPILEAKPEIKKRCLTAMEEWVEDIQKTRPDFAIDLDFPINFNPDQNPFTLNFHINDFDPPFDDGVPPGPGHIAYWRSSRDRFLFSSLWLDICEEWKPEGDWVRLDTTSHSILLELNRRTIFDPMFRGDWSAERALDMAIIGDLVESPDNDRASNVICWLNFHLKWHSRRHLPNLLEKALQHDLPEYLQIMQSLSEVEIPALKSQPLTVTQLDAIKAMPAPVNRRMI